MATVGTGGSLQMVTAQRSRGTRYPPRYGRLRTSRKPPAWPCLTIFMSAKRDQWSRPGVVARSETGCRQRSLPRGASQLTACPWAGRPDRDADYSSVSPGRDPMVIVPLWRSTTMRRAMSRPRLVPLPASLVVYKASNARAATCGGMPGAAVADLDDQVALFGPRRQPARAGAARATRPCNRGAPRLCSPRVIAAETMESSSTAAALFRPGHQHITIAIRARTITWPGT